MPGVDEQHLDLLGLTQGMKDRLPVHPGRFHRHMGDASFDQPGHHLPEHLVIGLEHPDLLSPLPGNVPGVRTATATSRLPTSIPATRG